jgi:D-glycero-D-manno-heptose 1,7-bisphosphate phosphatase
MRTIFVGRDGVINVNRPSHVTSWEELDFIAGALDALALLTRAGYRILVLTNQAIVNRGADRRSMVSTDG